MSSDESLSQDAESAERAAPSGGDEQTGSPAEDESQRPRRRVRLSPRVDQSQVKAVPSLARIGSTVPQPAAAETSAASAEPVALSAAEAESAPQVAGSGDLKAEAQTESCQPVSLSAELPPLEDLDARMEAEIDAATMMRPLVRRIPPGMLRHS